VKREKENILRTSLPLFSASLVGQGINFFLVFLLPILFDKEEIGRFFVFSAIGLLLGSLVSWSSFNTILLSSSQKSAKMNLGISLLLGGGTSFFLYVFLYTLSVLNFDGFFFEGIFLLPFFVFMENASISFEYYLNFQKEYAKIGRVKLVKAVSVFLLTILFGFLWDTYYSLVLAFMGGQVIVLVYQYVVAGTPHQLFRIQRKEIVFFFVRHRDILVFNSSLAIVSKSLIHLPTVLISLFYGEGIVALFGMAQRLISTPMGLLGGSVSVVFGKVCVEKFIDRERIFSYLIDSLRKILWLFVPFGLLVFFFVPLFFVPVFGQEWEAAGTIVRVLIPLSVIQNSIMPFTILNTILNFQKRIFIFYSFSLVVRMGLLFIIPYKVFQFDYISLLMLLSFSGVLHYLYYFKELFKQVKIYDHSIDD